MTRLPLVLLLTMLLCAGCGDDTSTPTSASSATAVALTSTVFAGVVQVSGSRFFSYTVGTPGTVTVMLASLTTGAGAVAAHRLELGIGIPAGTGCSVQQVTTTAPTLVPQLTQDATAGTYCVNVADAEGLPAPMNFAIRIVHP